MFFASPFIRRPPKDMVHGMGTIVAEDDSTKRRAIYWRDRRICFLDGKESPFPALRVRVVYNSNIFSSLAA